MNNQERMFLIKKLLYLSYYRGCKELAIILSNFTKQCVGDMTDNELLDLLYILNYSDTEILSWYNKKSIPPDNILTLLLRIINFDIN